MNFFLAAATVVVGGGAAIMASSKLYEKPHVREEVFYFGVTVVTLGTAFIAAVGAVVLHTENLIAEALSKSLAQTPQPPR